MTETYTEIVERIRELLLSREGRTKVEYRRDKARGMAEGLRQLQASAWVANARRRAVEQERTVFTVRQGTLQRAASGLGLEISVEFRGTGVGTLMPPASDLGYPTLKTSEVPPRELEWGGSDARDYIRSFANSRQVPERDLQGIIVQDLFKSPKHKLLQNLMPVRPANCLMEIPAAVTLKGKIGTGNIDLLLRTGRGRWPTFVVGEIKAETRTKPYEAMKQAIQYLAALDVEVNGIKVNGIKNEIEPADRAVYRTLFGSNSTSQDELRFGAMAIIPSRDGVEDEARKTLEVLDDGNVWLDIMLFDPSESGNSQPVLRLRDSG